MTSTSRPRHWRRARPSPWTSQKASSSAVHPCSSRRRKGRQNTWWRLNCSRRRPPPRDEDRGRREGDRHGHQWQSLTTFEEGDRHGLRADQAQRAWHAIPDRHPRPPASGRGGKVAVLQTEGVMTKNIYKGRIVNLNLETVTLPNGATVELEVIHHPGAAAVVPLKDARTVILIRQYRHAVGGYIYEIPAGKLHPGEDPRECALRELEEEIGYKAGELQHVTSAYTTPGFTDEVIHIYKATQLQRGKQSLGHDEVLAIAEFPLERTIAMIREGVIAMVRSRGNSAI